MPTLAELQARMARTLLTGAPDAVLLAAIAPGRIEAGRRLGLYRNNVIGALTSALRLTYPTVDWLVGAAFFDHCAEAFIERHAPGDAYLGLWGERFVAWLERDERLETRPYIVDTARLDLALSLAGEAQEAPRLGAAHVLGGALDLILRPHPALRLLRLDYPVQAIRSARLAGDEDRLADLDVAPRPHALLIERHAEDGVCIQCLEPRAAALTEALIGGAPLGAVIELAVEAWPDFDPLPTIAEHLGRGRFIAPWARRSGASPF